ncbi:MAG: KamA family radical SAM protein [Deltaproteobacteria bacterium]|nr:KamA family radical SAM protein [Deltaproteobacteria bacterium]
MMNGDMLISEDLDPLGCRKVNNVNVNAQTAEAFNLCEEDSLGSVGNVEQRIEFRKKFFPGVTDEKWNSWHWQLRNRIVSLRELERIISLSKSELWAMGGKYGVLPFAITPYYASLLDPFDAADALRRTVIPVIDERKQSDGESEDPLNEDIHSPIDGLVHRYPDRVLFIATDYCSTYCRYCTRSRMVGKRNHKRFTISEWQRKIDYIAGRKEIRDVLLSGGDPLTLSDGKLEWLVSQLRRIPHVEIIRIGTKAPVVLPQRMTSRLAKMLKKFHPIWINIHFTHPDELTAETRDACNRLSDAGIPLQSQTVLLSRVNDDVAVLKRLFHGLLKIRVRPYYLYQCDPITGSAHFRTPVRRGIEIIEGLRGYTTGFAVPLYVIDAPGGGGKIPIMDQHIIGRNGDILELKNYSGDVYHYHDCKGILHS